jgi:hypothetical protein
VKEIIDGEFINMEQLSLEPLDIEPEWVEWDGNIANPYESIMSVLGLNFIFTYQEYLQLMFLAVENENNKELDMRIQFKCDECIEWGPCNITYGLEDRACHKASRKRKDGFYIVL